LRRYFGSGALGVALGDAAAEAGAEAAARIFAFA